MAAPLANGLAAQAYGLFMRYRILLTSYRHDALVITLIGTHGLQIALSKDLHLWYKGNEQGDGVHPKPPAPTG